MELKLLAPDSPEIPQIRRINDVSFPDNERVPIDELFRFGGIDVIGITNNGETAGFLAMRRFADLAYIAYFAIAPEIRSQGIGTAALKALHGFYADCQIAVDIEAPDDKYPNNAQRLSRRGFYMRCGFIPTGWFQFYMDTEFEIFSSVPDFNKTAFEDMNAEIHAKAPEFDPHLYRKGNGEQ